MSEQERDLVTAIQEKIDNGTLTIRLNGEIIGRVRKWGKNDWRIELEEPPSFGSLEKIVDWLVMTRRS